MFGLSIFPAHHSYTPENRIFPPSVFATTDVSMLSREPVRPDESCTSGLLLRSSFNKESATTRGNNITRQA